LVLHMKRFTKTMFGQDKINTSITKNRTIINFPVKGLDLQECAYSFRFQSTAQNDLIYPLSSHRRSASTRNKDFDSIRPSR
jgi:hypothetical protein